MFKQTLNTLKAWATRLKREIYTLYVAMRDPRTPTIARYVALFVIGYALSPIDLIPDFIPVVGLLDDLILLPLGITVVQKMIPSIVMVSSRRQAEKLIRTGLPASRTAAMVITAIWALVLSASVWWFANRLLYSQSPHNNVTTTTAKPTPLSTNKKTSDRNDRSRSRSRDH